MDNNEIDTQQLQTDYENAVTGLKSSIRSVGRNLQIIGVSKVNTAKAKVTTVSNKVVRAVENLNTEIKNAKYGYAYKKAIDKNGKVEGIDAANEEIMRNVELANKDNIIYKALVFADDKIQKASSAKSKISTVKKTLVDKFKFARLKAEGFLTQTAIEAVTKVTEILTSIRDTKKRVINDIDTKLAEVEKIYQNVKDEANRVAQENKEKTVPKKTENKQKKLNFKNNAAPKVSSKKSHAITTSKANILNFFKNFDNIDIKIQNTITSGSIKAVKAVTKGIEKTTKVKNDVLNFKNSIPEKVSSAKGKLGYAKKSALSFINTHKEAINKKLEPHINRLKDAKAKHDREAAIRKEQREAERLKLQEQNAQLKENLQQTLANAKKAAGDLVNTPKINTNENDMSRSM